MIDKDSFLKPLLPEKDVDLPGLGTVRVRGLSRAEAVRLAEVKGDTPKLECRILSYGLVDPVLTADELFDWYDRAPSGWVDLIVNAITALSAIDEGAAKSGVPGVRSKGQRA